MLIDGLHKENLVEVKDPSEVNHGLTVRVPVNQVYVFKPPRVYGYGEDVDYVSVAGDDELSGWERIRERKSSNDSRKFRTRHLSRTS